MMKRTAIAGLVLSCAGCASVWAQDAPQPQPAPGLTQQKAATAPSSSQHSTASAANPAAPGTVIPASAERHFRQGTQLAQDGDTAGAIEEYKLAIKDYPDYFEAHYDLGRIYLDRKGYTEAAAELNTAVGLRPNDANAHNNLGLALKHNRDFNGALVQYQDAVRLNPKMASAQNNLANVLYAKRDFNGAILHYRAALDLQPNSAETHMNMGSALDDA